MRLNALSLCFLFVFLRLLFCGSPEISHLWCGMTLKSTIWTETSTILYTFGVHWYRQGHFAYVACSGEQVFGTWGHLLGLTLDEDLVFFHKEAPKQDNRSAWTTAGTFADKFDAI